MTINLDKDDLKALIKGQSVQIPPFKISIKLVGLNIPDIVKIVEGEVLEYFENKPKK